jgi:hypothetical protein
MHIVFFSPDLQTLRFNVPFAAAIRHCSSSSLSIIKEESGDIEEKPPVYAGGSMFFLDDQLVFMLPVTAIFSTRQGIRRAWACPSHRVSVLTEFVDIDAVFLPVIYQTTAVGGYRRSQWPPADLISIGSPPR